ncbi:MAG: putative selenate reductase subunit YgfK [Candidatus Acetothermia bacterium]|jgi:putative selenate reductase|nr:putative selenate reductase subunit YgfK [Candidatus Acetothermia bacterium]
MPDKMRVQPFDVLLDWMLGELEHSGSIFGIHRSLFYVPRKDAPYASEVFGHRLGTPIGPAAGPHTQASQNIVSAWLCGARFIELKTVQVLDELAIPRPCIDMEDEGYNVEWSQELKLEESAREYIHAWALIHVLRSRLGFDDVPLGTIFNMSVGYNLAGIQSPPMTRFMDRLQDASGGIAEIQDTLRRRFPQFADVEIPSRITDNVTLSTMHGCPSDEIERIARFLLEERGLHTFVKLNPTLLGKDEVMRILHDRLGYREIDIPDRVFAHDLEYPRAVALIRTLQKVASARGLSFGVKLSNTLAMANHKGVLPGDEMYMSGRALYPITMNLFRKLVQDFDGDLAVSYSAGADAHNLTTILACGARPVTAVSDILKPGGYARFLQWLEVLEAEMRARGVGSLDELAKDRLANLDRAAADALTNPRYKKGYFPYGLPKVESGLDLFDCIAAPCVEKCAVRQDVPEYAWWVAHGEYDRALAVILGRNPLPAVTGHVCTNACQTRCTRNNYEEPVAIRALKRFAVEKGQSQLTRHKSPQTKGRVAIVGSGPSGLAAAYFLALSGVQVTIFEAQDIPGGMLALAPQFRLPREVVAADIERIKGLGVEIRLSTPVTRSPEALLADGFDAVYVACGFQRDARLGIEGEDGGGVFGALDFLRRLSRGERPDLGSRVLVIGGGNTAMDAARAARRLTGRPVTVVYRRTRAEMPAEKEEVEGLLAEGNALLELVSPERIVLKDGRVAALECVRNALGEPDADGRRRPVPIAGSAFQIEADAIIVAVGQRPDLAFLAGSGISLRGDGRIAVDPDTGRAAEHVYAGGDAVRGPATIVEACADGRRAAEAISRELGIAFRTWPARPVALSEADILEVKRARARKELQHRPALLSVEEREGFDLVEQTLAEDEARREAVRCLQCSAFCDKCVEVCPNRANLTYIVAPGSWAVPRLSCQKGKLVVAGTEPFRIEQSRQIVHVDDFCNACGNCATFCVHHGKPYLDKPRLFLSERDFEQESDNAFHIEGNTIRRREGGEEARLEVKDGVLVFADAHVRVRFTPDFGIEGMALKTGFPGTRSLRPAAEMAVLLRGVRDSLPFLLGTGKRG